MLFFFCWIMNKVREEIFSCILMEIMIQLIIFKIVSIKHLIHIIIIFIFFYLYSHGIYFHDHGYYNFYFYFLILSIITTIFLPLDCILFFNRNRIFRIIVIYLTILIIIYYFLYLFFLYFIRIN